MLVPLANEPRDYAWGSTTLLARLEGRAPADRPEAEVWFGDHPASPARTPDGTPLNTWLATAGATGAPARLPFLVKLLAAATPLSIQAHPSRPQAEAGFAREEASGIARDAAERTYRDDNHKPEVLIAVSDRFRALAGLRDPADSLRLITALGAASAPLGHRLAAAGDLSSTLSWIFAPDSAGDVTALIEAASTVAPDGDFAAELALVRDLARHHPGDPGVVVAMLMNLVTLEAGQALFLPAGVLHAYLEGLGVEAMAASDNVLRGGLTRKHIDVDGLLGIVDPRPAPPVLVDRVVVSPGVSRLAPGIPDFEILRIDGTDGADVLVACVGVGVMVATAGELMVSGSAGGSARLVPGAALLVTPDEEPLVVSGAGTAFLTVPGRS